MNNEIQFILYQLPEEEGKVQVVVKDETIWATQKAMAQLFGVGVPAISKLEDLIERENAFNMEQFAASVNEFLTFRRYALLPDKGKTSREEADRKAEEEYRLFNPTQRIDSDFDKEIRGLFEAE